MTIKFTVQGVEVSVNSTKEAAELIRALGPKEAAAKSKPAIRAARPNQRRTHRSPDPYYNAVNFLRAIKEGGSRGVRKEKMMSILDVKHAKGIGARVGPINEVIREFGFDKDDVYFTQRTDTGRIWHPMPRLDDALSALADRAKGDSLI